jgi:hypothetical protein
MRSALACSDRTNGPSSECRLPDFELERWRPPCIVCDMDRFDEHRKRADEAQQMADRTQSETDKASWLRIAKGWLDMLPKPKQSAEQSFNESADLKGTGHDDSEE